jgi:hypothetical protein
MKTKFYLTVDTEHSMGGAWADPSLKPVPTERHIFCRIEGKDHGIGWLCDELDRYKFGATFFAEMFGSLVFGKDDTRAWCQYLLQRGQDVQLHTHLNFYYYAEQQASSQKTVSRTDDLATVPSPLRGELLGRACELFRYATGYHPKAFRAGNWRADRALIAELAGVGIYLDSSYNPAARGGGSLRQRLPEPHLVGGIRPFDLVSLSSWEMRKALDDAHKSGIAHVVAVLHSFSGVKTKDVQYRTMRPDRVVRSRVRALLEYLAANRDRFEVATLGQLASELGEAQAAKSAELPDLGFLHPLARKVVQVVNSLYWT